MTTIDEKKVIDIVDDRMSLRFESLAQSLNKLHEDYHTKILVGVDRQIKETVNGKIDAIKSQLDAQDEILKEISEKRKFVVWLWQFLKIVGGVVVSLGGAIIMYKQLK